jgi:hypothetical protein
MAREEMDAPLVALVGLAGCLIVFLLIIAAQALYYRMDRAEREAKMGLQAPPQLRQLEAEQYGQLHSYRYLDAQKLNVAIPVDRAIELLVREDEERRRAEHAQPAG